MAKQTKAGQWVKGMPSPNPLGRGVTKAAGEAPGIDGVMAYSGYVQTGERNQKLSLYQKWVTYANIVNVAIVATGLRYFGNLLAGTDWHAEPNEAGGTDADRGAEIVTEGLLKAPMKKPWPQVVRKSSMYRPFGFSLHALGYRRRPDGMVVFSEIAHRPQHTIEQWRRLDETSDFDTVVQRSKETGRLYPLLLDECFYCVDDTLSDHPEGVGLLRHIVEIVEDLERYEKLERIAYHSDLGGTPIGRAPLAEIESKLAGKPQAEIEAAKALASRVLTDVMENRIKSPERLMYVLLDSATYKGVDPNVITTILKWGLEIIKSETNGLPEVNAVIQRELLQIARLLGIEFVMQGGDGKGSYAQHEDKTSMFATNLQTTLNELGWFATTQLGRRLVARNGLDPDTAAPTLVAEPISTEAVEIATRSLANLALAGLNPADPARNVIRKRLRLPPEPPNEVIEVRAPRAPGPPHAETIGAGEVAAAPDPTMSTNMQPPPKKRKRAA